MSLDPHHLITWQVNNCQGHKRLVPKTILTASLGELETSRKARATLWMRERNNKNIEVTGRDEGEGAGVKNRNHSYDTEMQKQQKKSDRNMNDNWKEELNICLLQRGVMIFTSHMHSEGKREWKREREPYCEAWQCAWSAGNIWHVLHFFSAFTSFFLTE